MQWQQVAENWSAFVDAMAERWPRADEADLIAIEGDRERLEMYLSQAHDLTRAEAAEEVEGWLMGAMPADVAMSSERDDENIRSSASHIPPGEDVYSEDRDFGDDRVAEPPLGRRDEG